MSDVYEKYKRSYFGYDTNVIMYDGNIKNVQEIKIGDKIMGDDFNAKIILNKCSGEDQLYKIKTQYDSFVVSQNHIITFKLISKLERDEIRNKYILTWGDVTGLICSKEFNSNEEVLKYKSSLELITNFRVRECVNKSKYWFEYFQVMYSDIEFDEQQIELDPYYLGLYLGIYNKYNMNMFKVSPEVDYSKYKNILDNYSNHIPSKYLYNSRINRLRLLAGIIDTDISMSSKCFLLVHSNETISKDICFLAKSLGFHSVMKQYNNELVNIYISGDIGSIPVLRYENKKFDRDVKYNMVTKIEIEYLGMGNYVEFKSSGNFILENFLII